MTEAHPPAPSSASVPGAGSGLLRGFLLVGLLTGLSNGVAKLALPLFALALHASEAQIGLVSALQLAGTVLLAMPVGALIDRHGSLLLFRIGGVGGALLYLLVYPRLQTPVELIAGALLFGLVNPLRMVATQAEFLHQLPQIGHACAGWQRAAHSSGMFFLGPLAGALMVDQLGFADTFRVVSASMLLAVLIGNRTLSSSVGPQPDRKALPIGVRLREQWALVQGEAALRASLGNEFVAQLGNAFFSAFAVVAAVTHFGLPLAAAASLMSVQGGVFVLTLFCGGPYAARQSPRLRLGLAHVTVSLGMLGMAVAPAALLLWPSAALIGFGVAWQHIGNVNCFAEVTGRLGRGRVGGLFNLAGPLGGVTGAVLGGLLAQRFGYAGVYAGLAVGFALLALKTARGPAATVQPSPSRGPV